MNYFKSDCNLLHDISQTGHKRPWQKHKLESLAVAKSMKLFEYLKFISIKIEVCGTYLEFKSCPNGHGIKLVNANFCRIRSCIVCAWRKSLFTYHQVLEMIHLHMESFSSDVPLLLTLTIPNCSGEDLKETFLEMAKGFKRMMERKIVKKSVKGWFRALETTYNEDNDTYHPHYHCLLIVPKNYFDSKYSLYIKRDDWLSMWQESMRDNSITQVDVRSIKKKKKEQNYEKLIAEVAKYATKPSSYIKRISNNEYYANPKVVETFFRALRNIRLLGFGGVLKDLRKKLKHQDVEKMDLISIQEGEKECLCKICASNLVDELYTWRPGLKNYATSKNFYDEMMELNKK
jgi:plasmid rolling circle replication initiator protein Rep